MPIVTRDPIEGAMWRVFQAVNPKAIDVFEDLYRCHPDDTPQTIREFAAHPDTDPGTFLLWLAVSTFDFGLRKPPVTEWQHWASALEARAADAPAGPVSDFARAVLQGTTWLLLSRP